MEKFDNQFQKFENFQKTSFFFKKGKSSYESKKLIMIHEL